MACRRPQRDDKADAPPASHACIRANACCRSDVAGEIFRRARRPNGRTAHVDSYYLKTRANHQSRRLEIHVCVCRTDQVLRFTSWVKLVLPRVKPVDLSSPPSLYHFPPLSYSRREKIADRESSHKLRSRSIGLIIGNLYTKSGKNTRRNHLNGAVVGTFLFLVFCTPLRV